MRTRREQLGKFAVNQMLQQQASMGKSLLWDDLEEIGELSSEERHDPFSVIIGSY